MLLLGGVPRPFDKLRVTAVLPLDGMPHPFDRLRVTVGSEACE